MNSRNAPAVELKSVSKSYGSTRANNNIDLVIPAGTIHAIVGENGAGKSTLMRILVGAESADAGEINIFGSPVPLSGRRSSVDRGVGMVYQELMLAPDMTVWENVVIGWEPVRNGLVDKRGAIAAIREMGRLHGLVVDPLAITGLLPLSQQQQVEILRVLYRGAKILILDEPTSVLTPKETEGFFRVMKSLAAEGSTVIFISHKLQEVLEVADEITVMRGGEVVKTLPASGADQRSLATLIVGHEPQAVTRSETERGAQALAVRNISLSSRPGSVALHDVSFVLNEGRILGVAGVSGNGQDELLEVLAGMRAPDGGSLLVGSESEPILTITPGSEEVSVRKLRESGVAYIPVDRIAMGSAALEPLWFSYLAGQFWKRNTHKRGLLNIRSAQQSSRAVVANYGVKAASVDVRPSQLSGGNLQKFIAGRELDSSATIILAADPTRGVDIGSAVSIRQEIRDRVDAGCAALLVSTDLDELLEIADDVIVMFGGRISGRFARHEVTAESLGRAMTGGNVEGAA